MAPLRLVIPKEFCLNSLCPLENDLTDMASTLTHSRHTRTHTHRQSGSPFFRTVLWPCCGGAVICLGFVLESFKDVGNAEPG